MATITWTFTSLKSKKKTDALHSKINKKAIECNPESTLTASKIPESINVGHAARKSQLKSPKSVTDAKLFKEQERSIKRSGVFDFDTLRCFYYS